MFVKKDRLFLFVAITPAYIARTPVDVFFPITTQQRFVAEKVSFYVNMNSRHQGLCMTFVCVISPTKSYLCQPMYVLSNSQP